MTQSVFPRGAHAALSLSFDDARPSQLALGLPILDAHQVRATFYVVPKSVRSQQDEWRGAAAAGHEIGNHTATHPCSVNHVSSRSDGLEDYTITRIKANIDRASREIEMLLGIRPQTFAYPCGQTFVGRGRHKASFVPVVARRFVAGRGYRSETANDPSGCDLALLDAHHAD